MVEDIAASARGFGLDSRAQSNSTQCSQPLATAATFFAAQAISRGGGPRHSLPPWEYHCESDKDLIFLLKF